MGRIYKKKNSVVGTINIIGSQDTLNIAVSDVKEKKNCSRSFRVLWPSKVTICNRVAGIHNKSGQAVFIYLKHKLMSEVRL